MAAADGHANDRAVLREAGGSVLIGITIGSLIYFAIGYIFFELTFTEWFKCFYFLFGGAAIALYGARATPTDAHGALPSDEKVQQPT